MGASRRGFWAIFATAAVAIAVSTLARAVQRPSGLLTVDGVYLGSFRQLRVGDAAPGFPEGADWLNTAGSAPGAPRGAALSMQQLRREGKMVLLHFWDYTSMRSTMAMPALLRWQKRYGAFGVEMIGVHRSRFGFAHRLVHVARAVERQGVRHAVVNDEHGDIARSYGSKEAPSMFLVGHDGRIAAVEAGIDGMEEMEYQLCLAAADKHPELWCGEQGMRGRDVPSSLSEVGEGGNGGVAATAATTTTTAAIATPGLSDSWMQWIRWRMARYACMQRTSDMPMGTSGKTSLMSHLQGYAKEGGERAYTDLSGVPLAEGRFVLSGTWASLAQGVAVRSGGARGMEATHLRARYHGKGAYALMGSEQSEVTPDAMCTSGRKGHALAGARCLSKCEDVAGERGAEGWCETSGGQWGSCTRCGPPTKAVRVWVTLDGAPVPNEERGVDVEEDALGRTLVTVHEPRIYALVQGKRAADHSLTLLPEKEGLVVHQLSFTAECDRVAPRSLAHAPPAVRQA